ncbi:hypothetical protein [Lacisediminihabitans changchengi]|uniref:Uncharacterized protein n=1 Tax=Lacisediminihabitans changchengi TaxID=2787634 RepID=A0A934W355_9MICO|nr:hypothetical protein [Lacisediminihabitans changchengi]MBK4348603.1 hypothetical protein [Lacisediminihabitans changchengi]
MNISQTHAQVDQVWPVDIEVGYQLVARVCPTGTDSRYEIRLGQVLDGELHESGEPFEASFGPDFDEALRALRH